MLLIPLKTAGYEEYREQVENAARSNPFPFKDWFDENGRTYIPFQSEEAAVDEDVVGVLSEESCEVTDYRGGYCRQGKRIFRITKVLNQAKQKALQDAHNRFNNGEVYDLERELEETNKFYDDVINTFVNSAFRVSKEQTAFNIVISQNPHDVAQMSTGRGWTSCMELGSDGHSQDIFCEVAEGGLVAYLIRFDDPEIQNPLARIAIRRFVNKDGESVAFPEDSIYGNELPGFGEQVRDWLNSKQKIGPGFYRRTGGEYSDTFSGRTQLVGPSDPKAVMDWFNGNDPNARFSTWTVVDNLYSSEVAWDEDEEEEVEFDTREEAETHVSQRDYDDSWRDYYGGEWVEQDEQGNWVKDRYDIIENAHDYRAEMKRHAIKAILEADRDTYPMELIEQIKAELDFSSRQGDYRNARLRDLFVEKYPELLEADDYYRMGQRKYHAYINELPDGPEKDQLKEEELKVAMGYLENPMHLVEEDDDLQQQLQALRMSTDINSSVRLTEGISLRFANAFGDKILGPLGDLFKPIPEPAIRKLVNFAENIEDLGLTSDKSPIPNKNTHYDNQIISRIVTTLYTSHSDTPTVQKFYWDLVNSPRYGDTHKGRENYSDINVETIGGAIARLGANGQQFLPWAQERLVEEQRYYAALQANTEERRRFYGHDHVFKSVKKNVERYLYIIDALENGTGRSTKYRFY
ncbi:MAG: hypothetical protein ACXAC5_03150 [Promethearchaeota archaeon]|jgi:hypothetical protein